MISIKGCLTIFFFTFIGTLIFNIPGAIIGFLIGVAISQSNTAQNETHNTHSANELEEFDPYLGLCMAIVRQNPEDLREVHKQTALRIIHEGCRRYGINYEKISERFLFWENQSIPVKEFAGKLKENTNRSILRDTLVELMVISLADGRIQEDEEGILKFIATRFGFSDSEFHKLFEETQQRVGASRTGSKNSNKSNLDEAYETLDLNSDASESEVEKRYKELAQKYHPDNFNNESEEAKELAQEKMMKINQAYRTIMEE